MSTGVFYFTLGHNYIKLPYMTTSEKAFVDFVRSECKKHGVKIKLNNSKSLRLFDNGKIVHVSGYFSEEEMVIAVAKNHPHFVSTLAHEYCHLTQFVEQCEAWTSMEKHDSSSKVWDWLSGKRVNNVKKHLVAVSKMELDNEKRTVKIMKQFGIEMDLSLYTQRANAYVFFYHHLYYTRKWCTFDNSPYRVKEIYENMSPKFNMGYSKMSKKTKNTFDKVYLS